MARLGWYVICAWGWESPVYAAGACRRLCRASHPTHRILAWSAWDDCFHDDDDTGVCFGFYLGEPGFKTYPPAHILDEREAEMGTGVHMGAPSLIGRIIVRRLPESFGFV